MLRHGHVYRTGTAWTQTHDKWLSSLTFAEPADRAAFAHYRACVATRQADLDALERDLHDAAELPELAPAVARLGAYRGVAELGALTLTAEVGDWRRFPTAGSFMAFTGLVPSEYSSGSSQRRGHITKTGNAHVRTQLVESAWAYQHRPLISTPQGAAARRRRRHPRPLLEGAAPAMPKVPPPR